MLHSECCMICTKPAFSSELTKLWKWEWRYRERLSEINRLLQSCSFLEMSYLHLMLLFIYFFSFFFYSKAILRSTVLLTLMPSSWRTSILFYIIHTSSLKCILGKIASLGTGVYPPRHGTSGLSHTDHPFAVWRLCSTCISFASKLHRRGVTPLQFSIFKNISLIHLRNHHVPWIKRRNRRDKIPDSVRPRWISSFSSTSKCILWTRCISSTGSLSDC